MAHNRHTALYNAPYPFRYGYATLQFNCLGTALLDETGGVP